MLFSDRIKELRLSLGLNQVEFGKKIETSKQSVCNWENSNIMPSIDMLIKISKTFSVSTDYLLGISNDINLDATGLTTGEIFHIQCIIDSIREDREY